jgi:hypothetical protein
MHHFTILHIPHLWLIMPQVTRVAPGSKCCGWELRCLLEAASGTQFQKYAWLLVRALPK